MKHIKKNLGFALLITLVTISITLSIGLTILEVTLKQFSLSSTGRDSEMAIHASIAGAECMEYWRGIDQNVFLSTSVPIDTIDCFNKKDSSFYFKSPVDNSTYPNTFIHHYEVSWNEAYDALCSKMSLYLIDARGGDVNYPPGIIPGSGQVCVSGSVCKIIVSDGYNRSCDDLDSIRVTEREFLLY